MDLIESLKGMNPDLWWTRAVKVVREGMSTYSTELTGMNGSSWKAARKHKVYIDQVLDNLSSPCEGKAAIVGGMPGAGKSKMLPALFNPKEYFVIDPDDIKQWFIENDLYPHLDNLTPLETAPFLHVESTAVAKKLSQKLAAKKANVIWPMTFSALDAVENRVNFTKKNGYKCIDGAFVDVSTETSTSRVKARYASGMQSFILGRGLGGRFIDLETVARHQNAALFKHAVKWFTTSRILDNDLSLI